MILIKLDDLMPILIIIHTVITMHKTLCRSPNVFDPNMMQGISTAIAVLKKLLL